MVSDFYVKPVEILKWKKIVRKLLNLVHCVNIEINVLKHNIAMWFMRCGNYGMVPVLHSVGTVTVFLIIHTVGDVVFVLSMITSFLSLVLSALVFNERKSR